MKKALASFLIISLAFLLSSFENISASAKTEYPSRNINAVVAWGAGGGTDQVMRPLCSIAERYTKSKIIVQNKTGGTGSIATQYVYDSRPDGYTMLLHAENPALYHLLGISDVDFDDFDCVLLIGDETTGIIVRKDSPYNSMAELIKNAKENPGRIKLATTGVGGLPWEMYAMLYSVTGASFLQVPYDSDASALMAVLNGECDFTVCKIQNGYRNWANGDISFLTLFSSSIVPGMEEIPLITSYYPSFEDFLPWGPFYGIYVKKGTDHQITDYLKDIFIRAFETEEYQKLLSEYRINPYGYSGAEAEDYIKRWKVNTENAIIRSGAL